jgi:hypothetical protein
LAETRLSPPKLLLLWLALILLLAGIFEGASSLALRLIKNSAGHFLVWAPDTVRLPQVWADAAGQWDDEVGWPSPQEATAPPRDRSGAKRNADFPEPGNACASIYGDSFVWGDDIPPDDGWVEQMSRQLKCRVANYGVSGYGTDQALLRFRRMTGDEAPVVMLGIFPENVLRNVNQYRAFLGAGLHPRWLKSRFVLDATGALEWVARPRIDLADFIALHVDPARIVPRDELRPGSHDGPVVAHFPYTLSAIRLALMPRVLTRFTGKPSWADFYDLDHPSGAVALTAAIAEAFSREATARGKRPLVVMLPGASSFRAREKFGAYEYAPLVAAMAARNVETFDAGPALLAALGSRSPCELYAQAADCNGHFGAAGGAVLAQVIAAELRRRGGIQ